MRRRSYALIVGVAAVLAFAGISLNAAPQSGSDLTVHETTTSEGGRGGGAPATAVSYISGNAIKRSSSDGIDMILVLDQGKLIEINNKKKTYSEITFQQLQETMDKAMAAMGQQGQEIPEALKKMMGGPITVTKQGPGENIAGLATEKYLMTGPWQSEIWAAPDVKLPPQYYDAMRARIPRNPIMDPGKMFDEMKKMNGFPVKTIMTMKMMGMEMKSTTVVTSIDKGAIPKTVFDIPAGYKKVDSNF